MQTHEEQLHLAAKFLENARIALHIGRPDLVRSNLEHAIGFMSQVYGDLQQEYLINRGTALPLTSGPVNLTDEPNQERITEYGIGE